MLIESNTLCFLFIGVVDQHGVPKFLNELIIQCLANGVKVNILIMCKSSKQFMKEVTCWPQTADLHHLYCVFILQEPI